MHVHHKHMSQLIKQYAEGTDEGDKVVRKEIRTWRTEIMSGNTVTIPGMPGGDFSTLEDFDNWRVFKFPRLFLKAV